MPLEGLTSHRSGLSLRGEGVLKKWALGKRWGRFLDSFVLVSTARRRAFYSKLHVSLALRNCLVWMKVLVEDKQSHMVNSVSYTPVPERPQKREN